MTYYKDLGPILSTLGRTYRWLRFVAPDQIELGSTASDKTFRSRILTNPDGTIRLTPPQEITTNAQ